MRSTSPLLRPLILLLALLAAGTLGYSLIERLGPLDALYLTVSTISTVGFGDVVPRTEAGRVFTIGLILVGVGAALFTLTELARAIYEGEFGQALWRRRMIQRVDKLRDHFILCGYGRVGRQIAEDLVAANAPLVVVDRDQVGLQRAAARGLAIVEGDAGSDEVLRMAGIERARGLVAAVPTDGDNIYVTLSARALNPRLLIVARAIADESIAKLERAGADRVVSPYNIGGRRMAMLALRPLSVELVDSIFHGGAGSELLLEDVAVGGSSQLVDRTVQEIQDELAPGVSILAIKRNQTILPRPPTETRLEAGDELVAIGTPAQLQGLEGLT